MTADDVRNIMLEELRHKGYAPNPADVSVAVTRVMALHNQDVEVAAGESVSEAKKLASAGSPLITMPPAK